jgi:hypothetical protein
MFVFEPDTYRYYIFNEVGTLVESTNNELVTYVSRTFLISDLEDEPFSDLNALNQLSNTLAYSYVIGNTNLANFTTFAVWTNNEIQQVCMKLYSTNVSKSLTLFDDCILFNAQTQIYINNVQLQNQTYNFEIYAIYSDDNRYTLVQKTIDLRKDYSLYGTSGIFLGFLIIGICALFGLPSLKRIILTTNIGLIISVAIGLIPLSWFAVAGIFIISIIGVYNIRD